jgi:hypothetical protein
VAATYDGATIKLYVNGVLESSLPAALTIASNTLPLAIGAQVTGTGTASRWFQGRWTTPGSTTARSARPRLPRWPTPRPTPSPHPPEQAGASRRAAR